jgi:hypothetical protein
MERYFDPDVLELGRQALSREPGVRKRVEERCEELRRQFRAAKTSHEKSKARWKLAACRRLVVRMRAGDIRVGGG